jgi:hypothetical protein
MDFAAPEAADFANVRSLNKAFLLLAREAQLPRPCLQGLETSLASRLQTLTELQVERLAQAPFLLFSLRERDVRYWDHLLTLPRNSDLFSVPQAATHEYSRLTAAGLGFVWQLASRNPFVARVVAGASMYWCERISERTIISLLAVAETRNDLLVLRVAEDSDLWKKLLNRGVMREDLVRRSAHLGALQTILTSDRSDQRQAWSHAARKIDKPGLRVADERGEL